MLLSVRCGQSSREDSLEAPQYGMHRSFHTLAGCCDRSPVILNPHTLARACSSGLGRRWRPPKPAHLSTIPGTLRAHLRKMGSQTSSTSSPGIRLETWFSGATQTVGLGDSGAGLGPWTRSSASGSIGQLVSVAGWRIQGANLSRVRYLSSRMWGIG